MAVRARTPNTRAAWANFSRPVKLLSAKVAFRLSGAPGSHLDARATDHPVAGVLVDAKVAYFHIHHSPRGLGGASLIDRQEAHGLSNTACRWRNCARTPHAASTSCPTSYVEGVW